MLKETTVTGLKKGDKVGLNPYFNGTCSKSVASGKDEKVREGLNPYFNGTCSKRSDYTDVYTEDGKVLILILMEHAQRAHFL